MIRWSLILLVFVALRPAFAQESPGPRVDVRVVTDQAEAALAILDAVAAGGAVADADREALFATEGFRRLEARERSVEREVDRDAFIAWLSADSVVARAAAYREAVEWWRELDAEVPARKAFAYLPEGAVIRARLYPMIKPQPNSFVFEIRTDPAIFIYLDPAEKRTRIENTLAHELHHVGTAGVPDCEAAGVDSLSQGARDAIAWVAGFAEGWAALAAAGGPDVHPHAGRDEEEFVVWERDVARADEDLLEMDRFFLDLARGRLTDEAEIRRRGFAFLVSDGVPQGPFYTVGWRMAALVEKAEGRDAVIAAVCDPRGLLVAWNRVAQRHARPDGSAPARWSRDLLSALGME